MSDYDNLDLETHKHVTNSTFTIYTPVKESLRDIHTRFFVEHGEGMLTETCWPGGYKITRVHFKDDCTFVYLI